MAQPATRGKTANKDSRSPGRTHLRGVGKKPVMSCDLSTTRLYVPEVLHVFLDGGAGLTSFTR